MKRIGFSGLLICLLLASGCASLPPLADRTVSTALQDTRDTKLGRAVGPMAAANAGKSGVVALAGGRDALAARVLLVDAAERSLDIQYYLWRNDVSGRLMVDALRRAADRGVRVRLLLDDGNTAGQDAWLAALDEHPSIEVRLFNPFVMRRFRVLGYLGDFQRLNRRMHNKSLSVDGQATIIGGRNIGDEYFDATDAAAFADLDVLAVGPVVSEVSADFDRYWNSASAYPLDSIVTAPRAAQSDSEAVPDDGPVALGYNEAIGRVSTLRDLLDGRLGLQWATTRMISDDPGKVLRRRVRPDGVSKWLADVAGTPTTLLELVSPYFVPMEDGVAWLTDLARRGVRVRVLTNSLAATDVVAVHAGYARWREPLLAAGVELYEYKRSAATPASSSGSGSASSRTPGAEAAAARRSARVPAGSPSVFGGSGAPPGSGSGGTSGSSPGSGYGSSSSSLHAKAFSVDGRRVFIGSFNIDPRSAELNTELGFVIDSPVLATVVDEAFTRNVPLTAYRLALDPDGALRWIESREGDDIVHRTEPDASVLRRSGAALISILPVDWLL